MRIMAIDYGTKSVGIAISDELQLTVRPLTTIRRDKKRYPELLAAIGAYVEEYEVGALAVGLPLNMDGTRGEAARRVEKFIADLQRCISIPIIAVDERLTSHEADRLLRAEGANARERRRRSDEYAAVIILEDYLASLPHAESSPA